MRRVPCAGWIAGLSLSPFAGRLAGAIANIAWKRAGNAHANGLASFAPCRARRKRPGWGRMRPSIRRVSRSISGRL